MPRDGLLEQAAKEESAAARRAPVKTKNELIQISLQVLPGDPALMGAEKPSFEQRCDAVCFWQRVLAELAGIGPRDSVVVAAPRQTHVAGQPVGHDIAARLDEVRNGIVQGCGRGVRDDLEPCATDLRASNLHGHQDKNFARGASATHASFHSAHERFVDFHFAGEATPTGADHHASNPLQPLERRMIRAETHGPLQTQRTDAVLLLANLPKHPEPRLQRMSGAMQKRARGDALLSLAPHTYPSGSRSSPPFGSSALHTANALGPAELAIIVEAARFCWEKFVELSAILGVRCLQSHALNKAT